MTARWRHERSRRRPRRLSANACAELAAKRDRSILIESSAKMAPPLATAPDPEVSTLLSMKALSEIRRLPSELSMAPPRASASLSTSLLMKMLRFTLSGLSFRSTIAPPSSSAPAPVTRVFFNNPFVPFEGDCAASLRERVFGLDLVGHQLSLHHQDVAAGFFDIVRSEAARHPQTLESQDRFEAVVLDHPIVEPGQDLRFVASLATNRQVASRDQGPRSGSPLRRS